MNGETHHVLSWKSLYSKDVKFSIYRLVLTSIKIPAWFIGIYRQNSSKII